jgi:hypothetical protein
MVDHGADVIRRPAADKARSRRGLTHGMDGLAQAASRNGSGDGLNAADGTSWPLGAPTPASSELWISMTPVWSAIRRAVGVYSLLETTQTMCAFRCSADQGGFLNGPGAHRRVTEPALERGDRAAAVGVQIGAAVVRLADPNDAPAAGFKIGRHLGLERGPIRAGAVDAGPLFDFLVRHAGEFRVEEKPERRGADERPQAAWDEDFVKAAPFGVPERLFDPVFIGARQPSLAKQEKLDVRADHRPDPPGAGQGSQPIKLGQEAQADHGQNRKRFHVVLRAADLPGPTTTLDKYG